MRYIKRTLSSIIQNNINNKSNIIISGISGSGKSSAALSVYEKRSVISLDNIKNLILACNGNEFFKKYGKNIIIDNIEQCFSLLENINEDDNLVLLSDNNIDYINESKKEYIKYKLHGLSIYELANMGYMQKPYKPCEKQPCIISHKSLSFTYQLIGRGFLMEAALLEDDKLWNEVINKKVEKIVDKSIIGSINNDNKISFLNFLKELAKYTAKELNLTEIAEKLQLAPNTIKSWVKLLESINFIYLVKSYSIDNKRRYIKTPKVYMEDTGIAAWLLDIENPKDLENHNLRQNLFENFVISEIIKSYHHNGKECKIYHYRDNVGVKIDLLIEDDDYIYPVYISDSKTPEYNISNINKAALHKPLGYGNHICLVDKSVKISDNFSAISIWEI